MTTLPSWIRRAIAGFLLAPIAALTLSGCAGYTLGPVRPTVMKGVETIAVHPFHSDVLQPRIEALLANVVIRQIQRDGTYKLADEKNADAILDCKLVTLDRRPNRGAIGNELLTTEYYLNMRVTYKITNRKTGALLDGRAATGATYFFATGSNTLASDVNQDEEQAIPIAADHMAEQLVSQLAEGF